MTQGYNMNDTIKKTVLMCLKAYKEQKEKEGYVPTIELLIEDLEAEPKGRIVPNGPDDFDVIDENE